MNEAEKIIARNIGARIREVRIRNGLSQSQLGALGRISFQQIQKYETGANNITAVRLQLLANNLGVAVASFYESPDQTASGPSPMRRKFLHLIQNLQALEALRPDEFLAICDMAASLTKPQKR